MNATYDSVLAIASMRAKKVVFVLIRFNSLSYFTHSLAWLCNLCNCRAINVNWCFFFWKRWIKGARGLSGIMLNSSKLYSAETSMALFPLLTSQLLDTGTSRSI